MLRLLQIAISVFKTKWRSKHAGKGTLKLLHIIIIVVIVFIAIGSLPQILNSYIIQDSKLLPGFSAHEALVQELLWLISMSHINNSMFRISFQIQKAANVQKVSSLLFQLINPQLP